MPTPDVVVNVTSATTLPPDASDTGQVFSAGVTQRGSIAKPVLLQSLNDYPLANGQRQTSSSFYDSAVGYFGESGKKHWSMRVASSTAAQATLNLMDSAGTPAISLVAKAAYLGDPDPGVWANGATGGLALQVINTSGVFQILAFMAGGAAPVEVSPAFASQQDAIGWSQRFSKYYVLTLGASSLVPATAAATSMAAGTDGTMIADADYQSALDLIHESYGPGQIMAPGRTSLLGGQQLLLHAASHNRFALLDGLDTSSDASLETQAAALYGTLTTDGLPARRYGQLFAPWDKIDGLTPYTYRTIPPSARAAAEYARVDQLGNPNQAAAGRNGVAQYVRDLSQPNWSKSQRGALNAAGITISRRMYGGTIMSFGMRTLADAFADQNWSMAPNVRAVMWFAQQAKEVGLAHDFDMVDPFGHELAAYQGDLMGKAKVLYDAGALWCPTKNVSDAINVDVGPSANPPSQLAQGIVQANVSLTFSPTPEQVVVNIIKTPMPQN